MLQQLGNVMDTVRWSFSRGVQGPQRGVSSTVTMRPHKTTEGRYRDGIATRYSRTGYGGYTLQTRNVCGPATELTSIGSRRRDAAESGDLA
jgi:hypothetical protein